LEKNKKTKRDVEWMRSVSLPVALNVADELASSALA